MTLLSVTAAVSFALTPLHEISAKVDSIAELGWQEVGRGDPWAVSFQKQFPEAERDAEAELRRVMGEYWLTAKDIRDLLEPKGHA